MDTKIEERLGHCRLKDLVIKNNSPTKPILSMLAVGKAGNIAEIASRKSVCEPFTLPPVAPQRNYIIATGKLAPNSKNSLDLKNKHSIIALGKCNNGTCGDGPCSQKCEPLSSCKAIAHFTSNNPQAKFKGNKGNELNIKRVKEFDPKKKYDGTSGTQYIVAYEENSRDSFQESDLTDNPQIGGYTNDSSQPHRQEVIAKVIDNEYFTGVQKSNPTDPSKITVLPIKSSPSPSPSPSPSMGNQTTLTGSQLSSMIPQRSKLSSFTTSSSTLSQSLISSTNSTTKTSTNGSIYGNTSSTSATTTTIAQSSTSSSTASSTST
jgi:hypothetical protein